MSIALRFDNSSLDAARSGVIWGGVWFELDGTAFPERRWSDLTVAVAVDALNVVRAIQSGADRRQISFFDGPYHVEFARLDSGDVLISTNKGVTVVSSPAGFVEFVTQVESAVHELIAACKDKGWAAQDDVRRLSAMVTNGR